MSQSSEGFREDPPREAGPEGDPEQLVLDLDGFEGPIDLLLELARDQKVDVTQISILALAEQYLAFVQEARRRRLELAADYLVMAAWLAYLKSRLLLPQPEADGEEPSGAEMAAALRFQMQRLQAMQEAGQALLGRPRLGVEVFPRGEPEALPVKTTVHYDCSLYDLLRAYGIQRGRVSVSSLRVDPMELDSVEAAMRRLRRQLGAMPGWRTLSSFLPAGLASGLQQRSAMAATFAASLELCRDGHLEIRQESAFGPIFLRASRPSPSPAPGPGPEDDDGEPEPQ